MKRKSVIFDLDGTIWQTVDTVVDAWNDVLQQYPQLKLRMDYQTMCSFMGRTFDEIMRMYFGELPRELALELMDKCHQQENMRLSSVGGVLYAGVEQTLQKLRRQYRLFIVSNCQIEYIQTFFDCHGLGKYFDDYEVYGRTGLPKGETIKLLIERNDALPAVYVGDTLWDYQSSQAAGIPFIFAAYGFGSVPAHLPRVESFEQLPDLLPTVL
ncbi:MAG: HAD family hydrolase [Bacillota bacterium]|nr:HAD family hydrolase [Bacillota bacterium]